MLIAVAARLSVVAVAAMLITATGALFMLVLALGVPAAIRISRFHRQIGNRTGRVGGR